MKRSRKWTFVAQEATRLSGLGLTPREIALRLELNKSTVTRWIASGKLPKPDTTKRPRSPKAPQSQTPEEWAWSVRQTYQLDPTDEQLLSLAMKALMTARNPKETARVQLAAMNRFQAIVKQLALAMRSDAEQPVAPAPEPPKVEAPAPVRERRADPRALVMDEAKTIQ